MTNIETTHVVCLPRRPELVKPLLARVLAAYSELIAQRLNRLTAIVGIDRVIASTDCGFGTFAGYGKIDLDVTWKKLSALKPGADIAAARA